ncbi:hypothetical protein [Pseudomonas aeruginosa]
MPPASPAVPMSRSALDNHGQGALVSKGAQRIDAASLDNAQGIVSGESDVTLSIAGCAGQPRPGRPGQQGRATDRRRQPG